MYVCLFVWIGNLCFCGGFVHLPDHDCLVGGAREEEGVVVGEVEGAHVVSVAGQRALHHTACVNVSGRVSISNRFQ